MSFISNRLLRWSLLAGLASSAATGHALTNAEPIQPIVPTPVTNPAQVELGKKLFFEPRLSKSGAISCNSCHNLAMGGADNLRTSIGDHWQQGPINSPTVLNARFNLAQFWDGRAANLKAQAGGPIANPGEMAFSHGQALDVLRSIPQYQREFKKAFGTDHITLEEVTTALAAFEETLVTPNSRFDQWLKGDARAINAQELAGYKLFKESGCVSCHSGINVGGSMFQKMGVVEPYKTSNPAQGRFAVTGREEDRMVFKVPSLRNIELTYPYFHDGSAESLEQAVDVMGRVQLGRHFTAEENAQIVAFLKTLTGEQPRMALPELPPSTAQTPRPRPF